MAASIVIQIFAEKGKKIFKKNSNKTLKVNRDKSKILKLFLNLENDKSEKFDSVKLDNMLDVKS